MRSQQHSQLAEKILEDEKPSRNSTSPPEQIEMVIEFGTGSASLWVRPNQDPLQLAQRFCFTHNIDPRAISGLASNIRSFQTSAFRNDGGYRIDRNEHDDKENSRSQANLPQWEGRRSRTKTSQSSVNDSAVLSLSRTGNSTQRYDVFERLYQDWKKKGNTRREAKEVSKSSFNTTGHNISLQQSSIQSCLNIYEKNRKLQEESRRQAEHIQQLLQAKQVQQCSFHPSINPLSDLIATKLRQLDDSTASRPQERQMTKIKQYLLYREQQEMKECTFQPRLSRNRLSQERLARNSRQKVQQSQEKLPRHLQLHQDHLLREAKKKQASRERLKKMEEQQHPAINRISQIIVKKNFSERLKEDQERRELRKKSQEKLKQATVQDQRPSTGRAPVNRDLGDKTIGQYLYEKGKASRANSMKQAPKIMTDPKSAVLYAQSKRVAFEYIFQLLDSDQDGMISSTRISINKLGQPLLRLLAPLLAEMEEVSVELNAQQFLTAFDRLFSTFSIAEKSEILRAHKLTSPQAEETPTFHPVLNEKSLLLARQLTNEDGDIYEQSCQRLRERQARLTRMRAERMLEEYAECSFHPCLRN